MADNNPTSRPSTSKDNPTSAEPTAKEESKLDHIRPVPNSPAWLNIPVHSLPRAKAFYQTLFPNWSFFSPPGAPKSIAPFNIPGSAVMGALVLASPETSALVQPREGSDPRTQTDYERTEKEGAKAGAGGKGITIYLMVEDVNACLAKAKDAGGVVTMEKFVEGGHTELGRFGDCEGNEVGVLRWLI